MNSFGSYPSIFNLGHKAVSELLKGPFIVEEKVDGSQFSFGIFPTDGNKAESNTFMRDGVEHTLRVRSKGAEMIPTAPEKMFSLAVESVQARLHHLTPGYTYRSEYLRKPRHNALAYNRVPEGHLIIFDINPAYGEFLSYNDKANEAARIGLECVPFIYVDYQGGKHTLEGFRQFLDTESVLGGQKIEGVVVKPLNYDLFGVDKKVLMGKFVSEAFKEVHKLAWKQDNPTATDIITRISESLRTPARWNKAIQHLRERGEIEDSPRDIGKLIPEVVADVAKECEDEIKDALFKFAWPHIRRGVTKGLPEWYKDELLKRQFDADPE